MKKDYQRPDMQVVQMQQENALLTMSIGISGYSGSTESGFSQDADNEFDPDSEENIEY